jgi:hypothetical protein
MIVEAKDIEVVNRRTLLAQATKCVEVDNQQVLHGDSYAAKRKTWPDRSSI